MEGYIVNVTQRRVCVLLSSTYSRLEQMKILAIVLTFERAGCCEFHGVFKVNSFVLLSSAHDEPIDEPQNCMTVTNTSLVVSYLVCMYISGMYLYIRYVCIYVCMYVCMYVCIFIKLHITAQSGLVILVILCHSR